MTEQTKGQEDTEIPDEAEVPGHSAGDTVCPLATTGHLNPVLCQVSEITLPGSSKEATYRLSCGNGVGFRHSWIMAQVTRSARVLSLCGPSHFRGYTLSA